MFTSRDPLDHIRIAAPCDAAWEGMAGDDRVRHCLSCELNVYNFAELTRDEIGSLLARTEGRVCVRLYQRADGTLITRDCPTALAALRRRVSRGLGAAAAALLSFSALITGCATATAQSKNGDSAVRSGIRQSATRGEPVLRGHVRSEKGYPLPGVRVVVRDDKGRDEFSTITGAQGEFKIVAVRRGSYRVEVSLEGFAPAITEHIPLQRDQETDVDLVLPLNQRSDSITITMGAPVLIKRQ